MKQQNKKLPNVVIQVQDVEENDIIGLKINSKKKLPVKWIQGTLLRIENELVVVHNNAILSHYLDFEGCAQSTWIKWNDLIPFIEKIRLYYTTGEEIFPISKAKVRKYMYF
ncbi:hypothetical protein HBP99_17260 [Listeria booriae]|uniref:hypothetical protein n=1 Tax=Listeria booriae TaxID=1552123 RepID=UPI00162844B9|nr:hypothetical protein [Listeria booriae]MBC2370352.1 hypothetical protein [Listeria booriae]